MGKDPDLSVDFLQTGCSGRAGLVSKPCGTSVSIGQKEYVIGGDVDASTLSIGVQIHDKSTDQWVIPTVLGTKPKWCKDHSVLVLSDDQVLVIKKDSTPDDSIWFLEVDTKYVGEQKIATGTEVVAWSKGVIGKTQKPIVISGPSGVGKGTLIAMLMKEFPTMFGFSVSHTTRAPRNMEKDGIHYHFSEKSIMEKAIQEGKFLEFASVHGNLYGTSVEAVEAVADSGKRCILDIDVQGARSVRSSPLEAIFIFVSPPSMKELEERLRARGTETEEQILKRLRNAESEIEQGKSSGIFDNILHNHNLEECYENLKKLLGLNETVDVRSTVGGIHLRAKHSLSKIGNKVIISPGNEEVGKASKNLIAMDVSCLSGGAPGRTRGIDICVIDSFSDSLN